MFNKIKFTKKFKKALPKKSKAAKKDDNYVFGIGGTYDLYGHLNDEGKMEFRLCMSGKWDTKQVEVLSNSMDEHALLQMKKEIEEMLNKINPNNEE